MCLYNKQLTTIITICQRLLIFPPPIPDCAEVGGLVRTVQSGDLPAARRSLVNIVRLVRVQVYYFSKCSLKIANKQYTSVKNDYEMTLNGESTIIPCEDSCDVPMVQCDFVSISDLENKEKDSIVGKDTQASSSGSVSRWRWSLLFILKAL